MSEQVYDWKRFWCPRSGNINLGDRGYLVDPDSEWGQHFNPDLVSLDAIAHIPCLVLLGEPGIGKSQGMKDLKLYTERVTDGFHKILNLDLHSYSSEDRLIRNLFESRSFTDLINSTQKLYIFLDSLDECLLRIETLASLLVEEFSKEEYRDRINYLYLRIACRTAVFPKILEEGLKQLWNDNLKIYELAPLRQIDVKAAVTVHGLDPDAFLKEVDGKGVVPFAIKPITLKFLINIFKRNNGHFSSNQRLADLYLDGCRSLCEEQNQSRRASRRVGNLEEDQRLVIAARIAAVTVFANRFAIWTEPDLGDVPDEDVPIRKLCLGSENINQRIIEVTDTAIREVLDTGLFSSRGSNRMGWAHQTYAEFLAAWYLWKNQVLLNQVKKLIFSFEDPEHKLIPQLHETAAWLASISPDVLQEIIKTDPDVLLHSDIPTDSSLRETILNNLLIQHEQEKLYDYGANHYQNYGKLKHPGLAIQLRPYIRDPSKQIDARDIAINITEVCEISELQEDLLDLALDSSQSIHLRVSATKALCSIGNESTRLKLKPIAISQLPEDEDDRLKGYAMQAVWSDHLTAEELFKVLTSPKNRNFFGSYQMFLNSNLVPKLRPEDLIVALNWIEKQGVRCFGHPFVELADGILLEAWKHFDLPNVAESFTNIALVQWREDKTIITDNTDIKKKFEASLDNECDKRHKLIEQAVFRIVASGEDSYLFLTYLTENILKKGDIFWLLEKFIDTDPPEVQRVWARLIQWSFNRQDAEEINAIITATETNNILREEFASYFEAVELNSATADNMKRYYLEMQERQNRRHNPILDPLPCERILDLLDQLESGSLSAWWQLNREMTLQPDSQYYNNEFELDLTKLPGWQGANNVTQNRIINGARQYILQQEEINYTWIGTNTYNRSDLSGCRALLLLLQKEPDVLNNLSSEIWKKWAPIIIAFPCNNQHSEAYLEIIRHSYLNAPDRVISTLLDLIDQENREHNCIFIIDKLEKCWDEHFKVAILEKTKDKFLNPKCMGQLLEYLLKHESNEAREFAKSLINFPLPSAEDKRERVVTAAKILVENSDQASWSIIWSIIQKDSSFGRSVFELVSDRHVYGISLNLTEQQLADLYIWLIHQYPFSEDPDYSNEALAHFVTTRENIGNFRDSILVQLKERCTLHSCAEIQRVIQELPTITWLKKTLLEAQKNMRRKTWNPPQPEEILKLVTIKQPPPSEFLNRIDEINQRTKQMADQPTIAISGGTFNGPVNLASNHGSQPTTIIGTQNNYFSTDEAFRQETADLHQFIAEVETKYPNVQTEVDADKILSTEIEAIQTDNPTRWQTLRHQMSLLKRQLLNPQRHLQATKATVIEVAKTFYEKSLIVKAIITYLDKLSEEPNQGD
ncbi:MAG TPA: hypothetical protein DEG17_15325 [Cyanobacteria bacterium UBA11149]|nr:hypothetical protein [Cyanobacteria bacterium UBA11367]HBK66517.1 hypothetical protein [Cyanobacteria bacterium UBA11166]HBS70694.1 hypothetical protein [Cyanobacteria bacterium UBA11153]HBW90204.1 hypothetical protein [Cyanobacteria bacterium UBA11149]HCA94874.1 hypothetical protein [Cyanobacteria bacterium UBA9226]